MNAVDRIISVFSPSWALQRVHARATLNQIEALVGTKGGYDAGKLNRLTKSRNTAPIKEHAVPMEQLTRLRAQSWDLYRNNPYARKIVRSLTSKVIGKGLHPEPLATDINGDPHHEFRQRAAQLWKEVQKGFDGRGMPGQGGQTLAELQRMALRAVILSGESLYRLLPIDTAMMMPTTPTATPHLHTLD